MTLKRVTIGVFALFAFTATLVAQTVTNALALPVEGLEPLPKTMSDFWTLGIAAVTPLLVTGIYKLVPKIPKLLLPVLTPFIGIGLGLLMNWLAGQNFAWFDLAKAGALAVFIREVINQAAKAALTPSTPKSEPPVTGS